MVHTSLPVYVTILMHVRENSLTTNTARLLEKLLKNCRILFRGSNEGALEWAEPPPWDEASAKSKPLVLFLFPSEDARDLREVMGEVMREESTTNPGQAIHLVVPDGNWKGCAKVKRRFASFDNVISVKLPPGLPSEFVLRKEPRPECVSTFEAVSRALGVIVNDDLNEQLMKFFRMKQDRLLYARGLKREHEVCGGIPVSGLKPWH